MSCIIDPCRIVFNELIFTMSKNSLLLLKVSALRNPVAVFSVQGLKSCHLPFTTFWQRRNSSLVSAAAIVVLLNNWLVFVYGHYKSHSRLLSPFLCRSQRGTLLPSVLDFMVFILWTKFLPDATIIYNFIYLKYFFAIYLLCSKVEQINRSRRFI